ncbi:MAG: hypothetical protein RMM58_05655 [Chloroflexota bacterium]|nr:hypothetical protein [Dehalococcoidia bacterium]MDW8253346.1 hypothetical protein [Chloroflexota bacterium]
MTLLPDGTAVVSDAFLVARGDDASPLALAATPPAVRYASGSAIVPLGSIDKLTS